MQKARSRSCGLLYVLFPENEKLHVEGFEAQNGVADLGQVVQQFLGILGADGLVSDHVGEVLNTVQLQSGSIRRSRI